MKNLLRAVLVAAAAATLLLVACGDDDDAADEDGTTTPVSTPTPDGSSVPSASPTPGSLETLAAYLEETGLDEETGELTEPIDCAEIGGDTAGDYCIRNNLSIYGAGRVVLYVADVEDTEMKVWEVHITLSGDDWEVTEVENLEPEQ